ncbi:hypothetical protein [uncultured Desulfosarcina sp.]|uniref:type II secretion system protein GspD n=1 Tax=uncultured Desulfosarcina sp. TaxID=218289 RepID=UPI0029C9AC2C|nr:hypothetical protein [uncultured Desulfosarcina sp.]
MSRSIKRVLSVLLIVLCGGCANVAKNVEQKIQSMQGPTFDILAKENPTPIPETTPPPAPGEEKPIVRVIKGVPVKSAEEARELLARKEVVNTARGLYTIVQSLVLRDVAVRTIAELLSEICGTNVVATNSVADQLIDIYLQDITLRGALDAICRLNDLWYREGGGIVTLMTRQEYVQDIEVRQSDQTRAFYIRYTNAADMAKVIQAAMGGDVHLEAIEDEEIYGHIDPEQEADVGDGDYEAPELNEGKTAKTTSAARTPRVPVVTTAAGSGKANNSKTDKPLLAILTVFKRNNCIVARSLEESLLNEMGRIIEALDTPTSQVLLEIRILQLTLGDGFESFFDFDWGDSKNALGLMGTQAAGSTTLDYLFGNDKISARIAFFEEQGRAEIISTPFLMAANNSKVEFFVGEETPLRDDVSTTTTAVGDQGKTMTTFEVDIVREELGTDVEMTTFINADGTVTLEFEAEISSAILNYSTIQVVNEVTGDVLDFPLDAKSTSEIKSILSARSGESIAIGGIIKETLDLSENKVPILGDIPGLGFFFREIANTKKKTETVIVLTPHVIMHPSMAGEASREFMQRKSSHEQITKGWENILEHDQKVKP